MKKASKKTTKKCLSIVQYIGKNVFIRTVTHHYTGSVVGIANGFMWLTKAAWIADDGRFAQCIAEGKVNEVEPYPDDMLVPVALSAFVDFCEWRHPLPRVQK